MIIHVIIKKSDTEGEQRTQYRELKEKESLFFYEKNLKFAGFIRIL